MLDLMDPVRAGGGTATGVQSWAGRKRASSRSVIGRSPASRSLRERCRAWPRQAWIFYRRRNSLRRASSTVPSGLGIAASGVAGRPELPAPLSRPANASAVGPANHSPLVAYKK